MRARIFASAFVLTFVAQVACAHGPQIQVTLDNNKITTRHMLDDDYTSAGITAPKSVYVIPIRPVMFGGQPISRVKPTNDQTFGPGLAYGIDQLDGGDRHFAAPFSLHVAGLEIWNGASFEPTGAEQLGLLQSSSNVNPDSAKTTTSGADLAVNVSATYSPGAHSSIRYTLLGDGMDPYASSRDGVYLAMLQLSGTQSPGITPADPFYFVLHKNAATEALAAAVDSLGFAPELVQLVPEPATVMLGLTALACCAAARRFGGRLAGR